jgi:hypothetical protein
VGTFGTGPFSTDGVLDLLDELGEMSEAERLGELDRLLSALNRNADSLMRDVYPDEIVAVAALVAISLPGGDLILNALDEVVADEVNAATLSSPAVDLVRPALSALDVVAGSNGLWLKGWVDEERRANAERTAAEVRAVLERAIRARNG